MFNAQELGNTAWAFATANRQDEKIFASFARAAERRLSEFNAQDVANTAWALATAKHWVEKLFASLARCGAVVEHIQGTGACQHGIR